MLKLTLLLVGTFFLVIGTLAAGFMFPLAVDVFAQVGAEPGPQAESWDVAPRFRDDDESSADFDLTGMCCVLLAGTMFMLIGYEPARSASWTPMVCYLICGLVLAPALCGVGWLLIHELRFQMKWETTRGAVSRRLFGDERPRPPGWDAEN